jgi:phage virion morphogenesis protein
MSVAIKVGLTGIEPLKAKLRALSDPQYNELLQQIGGLVESQTRTRIQSEKQSPSGEAWKAWSEKYARTRHGGHSLLQNEGDLLDSIQWAVSGDSVEIGSNLVYAATHQHGRGAIPARPYLGLSDEDQVEIADVIDDWLKTL